jgi:hypothetical protein
VKRPDWVCGKDGFFRRTPSACTGFPPDPHPMTLDSASTRTTHSQPLILPIHVGRFTAVVVSNRR